MNGITTLEQALAVIASMQASQLRSPVEFAFWPNQNKTLDWHADLSGTITMKTTDVAAALATALAAGKAEVKFFADAYATDGSGNQPAIRGASKLKEKVAKAA
jgi:hypothetical protein